MSSYHQKKVEISWTQIQNSTYWVTLPGEVDGGDPKLKISELLDLDVRTYNLVIYGGSGANTFTYSIPINFENDDNCIANVDTNQILSLRSASVVRYPSPITNNISQSVSLSYSFDIVLVNSTHGDVISFYNLASPPVFTSNLGVDINCIGVITDHSAYFTPQSSTRSFTGYTATNPHIDFDTTGMFNQNITHVLIYNMRMINDSGEYPLIKKYNSNKARDYEFFSLNNPLLNFGGFDFVNVTNNYITLNKERLITFFNQFSSLSGGDIITFELRDPAA